MNEADAAEKNSPPDHYAVFRLRDFRLYLIGRLFAVIGQQMLTVAVGWELYERTHSPLALGLVGLAEMTAMFFCFLPAGHLADNFNRKRIILGALLLSSSASLGLALISWQHANVNWIYACLFTAATARTFLWPASSAFLTSLVPRDLFPRAVTWNSGAFQLSSVAGPAVGGALIAVLKKYSDHPAAFIYLINFGTAMTCWLCVKMVRAHHVVKNPEPMTLKSLATGFRFIFAQRLILGLITLDMFAVFLGGATALLPVFAANEHLLNVGAGGLGLLQAALPLGSVACALYLAHRAPMQKAGRALLWCVAVFGLATIAFGLSHWFWFSFAMLALAACYWAMDLRGWRKWTAPWLVFGMNAILAYILAALVSEVSTDFEFGDSRGHLQTLHGWIYQGYFVPHASPVNASLAFAIFFVVVIFLLLWPFYKWKIFVRI